MRRIRFLSLILLLVWGASACQTAPTIPPPLAPSPTATIAPSPTPIPPTPTPTAIPTPAPPPLSQPRTPEDWLENPSFGAPPENAVLRLGRGYTLTAALAPAGDRLALARLEGVYLCALPEDPAGVAPLACTAYLPHTAPVLRLAFHPQDDRLATLTSDGQVQLWDVNVTPPSARALPAESLFPPGQSAYQRSLQAAEADLAFSPDGRYLAIAAGDILLWDLENDQRLPLGEAARPPEAETASGWLSLAFTPDGRLLAGDQNGRLFIQPVTQPAAAQSFETPYTTPITALTLAPTGEVLAIYEDGTLALLDAANGQLLARWAAPGRCSLQGRPSLTGGGGPLAYARLRVLGSYPVQDDVLITASGCGEILRFSLSGHRALPSLPRPFRAYQTLGMPNERSGTRAESVFASFTPDGERIVAVWGDGTVDLWEVATEEVLAEAADYAAPGRGVSFDPLGRALLSTYKYGTGAQRWDPLSGQVTPFIGEAPLVFAPDGCYALAYHTGTANLPAIRQNCRWPRSTAPVLEVDDLALMDTFSIHPAWLNAVDLLALTPGETRPIYLIDPASGQVQHTLQDPALPRTFALAADPLEARLYQASDDGQIGVWDVMTGQLAAIWQVDAPLLREGNPAHYNRIIALAPSAGGKQLLASRYDGLLALWDTASGQLLATWTPAQLGLPASATRFSQMTLSADGRWFAGLTSGAAGLWIVDLQNGAIVATLPTYGDADSEILALSPDERLLALNGAAGATTLWSLPAILSATSEAAFLPQPRLPETPPQLDAFRSLYTLTLQTDDRTLPLLRLTERARFDLTPARRHFQISGRGWPLTGEAIWSATGWLEGQYAFRAENEQDWYLATELVPPPAPLLHPWDWQNTGFAEAGYRYTSQSLASAPLPPPAWLARALETDWAVFVPASFTGEVLLAPDGLLMSATLAWEGTLRTPQGETSARLEASYRIEDTLSEAIPLPAAEEVIGPLGVRPAEAFTPAGIPLPEDATWDEESQAYLSRQPAYSLFEWYQAQLRLQGFTIKSAEKQDMGSGFFTMTLYTIQAEKDGQRYDIILTTLLGYTSIAITP